MYKKKVQIGEAFSKSFKAKIDSGKMSSRIQKKIKDDMETVFDKRGFTSDGNRLFKRQDQKIFVPAAQNSNDSISSCRLSEESEERA